MSGSEFTAKMAELRREMKDICDRQGIVDPIEREALIGRPSLFEILHRKLEDD